MTVCIGPRCSARAVHLHHVITRQEIRRRHGDEKDPRVLVPTCFQCHSRHHDRVAPFPLWVLPDAVYEYAVELMGHGPAFNYLRRYYSSDDPRHSALLGVTA